MFTISLIFGAYLFELTHMQMQTSKFSMFIFTHKHKQTS